MVILMGEDKAEKKTTKRVYACKKCITDRVMIWILTVVVTVMAVMMFHMNQDISELSEISETVDKLEKTVNAILQYLTSFLQSGSSGKSAVL
jgi:cell division protein FtsL